MEQEEHKRDSQGHPRAWVLLSTSITTTRERKTRDETRQDETRRDKVSSLTTPQTLLADYSSKIGTAILALQLALHQIKSQLPNRPKQPRPSSPCPELQRVPSPKLETSSKSNRYTGAAGVLICSGLCDSRLPPPEIRPRKGPRAFQAFPSVFAPEVRILTASHPEWSSVHSTVHT